MSDILCIYHGNCADGFSAAWAVWKRFPDAQFHAGVYGQEPPDVKGKHVVLVDFCYKPDVLDKMTESATSILILDHHKSAVEAVMAEKMIGICPPVDMFNKYTGDLTWERHLQNAYQDICEGIYKAVVYTVFDMDRSGAMIAWQFFHPEKEIPQLIKHVQDRDLWKFELGYTKEIQAAVFSYPYDFETWDWLMSYADDVDGHKSLVHQGRAITRKHEKDIAELLQVTMREMNIGGYLVWVSNLPYTMASDACHALCKTEMYPKGSGELRTCPEFAASYYDTKDGRVFSLRSIGDFDVSAISKQYGGGGHKNAAGFKMPIGWEGETK